MVESTSAREQAVRHAAQESDICTPTEWPSDSYSPPTRTEPVRWRLCGWFWDKRQTKVNKLLCHSGPLLA
jgi:hypothetical protein